jgi:hypothetical protein
MWTVGGTTLVLAANMDYASAQVDVTTLGLGAGVKIQQVVISGAGATATVGGTVVSFGSVGSGAWVVG